QRRRGPVIAGWAVLAFSGSIVAILVSAYHGNVDSLCVSLCLLSAYLCERELPLAGGLALAGALHVQLLPVGLIPAFMLSYRSWRELLKFSVGLAVGLLPFLPFFICCGNGFYQGVVAYNSNVEHWGIPLFLLQSSTHMGLFRLARRIGDFYIPNGRFV